MQIRTFTHASPSSPGPIVTPDVRPTHEYPYPSRQTLIRSLPGSSAAALHARPVCRNQKQPQIRILNTILIFILLPHGYSLCSLIEAKLLRRAFRCPDPSEASGIHRIRPGSCGPRPSACRPPRRRVETPWATGPGTPPPPCPCDFRSGRPPGRIRCRRRSPAPSRPAPAGSGLSGSRSSPPVEALLEKGHGLGVVPDDGDGGVAGEHRREWGHPLDLCPTRDSTFRLGIDHEEDHLTDLLPARELQGRPGVSRLFNGLLDGPQAEVVGHAPVDEVEVLLLLRIQRVRQGSPSFRAPDNSGRALAWTAESRSRSGPRNSSA